METLKTSSRPAVASARRATWPLSSSQTASADRRADFYGLACVAFEALSGRPVIAATDLFDIIREHASFVLPRRDDIGTGVSQEMYEVLLRGLEHDPDKRSLDFEKLASWAAPLDLNG